MSDARAPQRIVVIGNTASGKSTLSAALAERFDLAHLELDSFAHGPGWQLASPQQFREALQPRTSGGRWVCDGNYLSRTTDWLWPQADTVIWLDLPLRRILPRLVARSLRRILTRQELWNGNHEQWSALIGPHSLVAWAVACRRRHAALMPPLLAQAREHKATTARITSPRQLHRWWQALPPAAAG